MELSNTEAELALADLPVWFELGFIVCPQLEAIKRDEMWKWEGFSSLVAEGKCLFYVLAICANNDCPDCFVFQRRRLKKNKRIV